MLQYNKQFEPLKVDLPIKIYGTGSSGNSTIIQPINTMIDAGLSYTKYEEKDIQRIDHIFITHRHSDHIKFATINKLLNIHPNIKIYIPAPMEEFVVKGMLSAYEKHKERIRIIQAGKPITLTSRDQHPFVVTPYSVPHGDIITFAYDIEIPHLLTRMLYATDLESTTNVLRTDTTGLPQSPEICYNLIMLEANYDVATLNEEAQKIQEQIQAVRQKLLHHPENAYLEKELKALYNLQVRNQGNTRHLDEATAMEYVQVHLTENGIFIPLHASSTFGNYVQHLK